MGIILKWILEKKGRERESNLAHDRNQWRELLKKEKSF
jgi:hypothetical protein